MDYSYIPQMYQQGLENGLQKQFALANSAQPVTQFLAALRQAKQDQLQQQMEEDRQRRLDIQQAQQEAMNKRYMAQSDLGTMKMLSQDLDGSQSGYEAAQGFARRNGMEDLLPKPTVKPGVIKEGSGSFNLPDRAKIGFEALIRGRSGSTAGQSELPDAGDPNQQRVSPSNTAGIEDMTVTPAEDGSVDVTATPGQATLSSTVYPKGAAFQQKEAVEAGKNARAEASRAVKLRIAEGAQEIAMLKAQEQAEMNAERKALIRSRVEHLAAVTERATRLLELGEPEAAYQLIGARTNQANAIAASASSQVPLNEARTGLVGAQQGLTEKRTENADMTDSQKAAARALGKKKGLTPVGSNARPAGYPPKKPSEIKANRARSGGKIWVNNGKDEWVEEKP